MTAIAGEDSLQALVLALSFAESIVVSDARKMGGEIISYGVTDAPLLCHSTLQLSPKKKPQPTKAKLTPEP